MSATGDSDNAVPNIPATCLMVTLQILRLWQNTQSEHGVIGHRVCVCVGGGGGLIIIPVS